MGERVWTAAQEDAIGARGGTVLVSAAAGSGKTSVLVARVIGLITDPKTPVPADRLLIVTFTKAAAAEMKERVEKEILLRLKNDPGNKALKRQQLRLPRMHISTIDSFCATLVREYFYLLGIRADFRILSDKQQLDLMNEAMDEVLEAAFAEELYTLADAFSTERSDDRLKDILLSLYRFTGSHVSPLGWLTEKLNLYRPENYESSPWVKALLQHGKEVLSFCLLLLTSMEKTLREDEKLFSAYGPVFLEDKAMVEQALQKEGWDNNRQALQKISFGRLPSLRGYADDPLKNMVCEQRDTVKKAVKKLQALFADPADFCAAEIAEMHPVIAEMTKLVTAFSGRYDEKKREKGLADYGDLEHWALDLLRQPWEGGYRESPLALEIAERFDEIMVDEYQDTNEVQDWLFRALSKGEKNKFMVGDVKQCIYSFRQAMPDIFLGYKYAFSPYTRGSTSFPATIVLDRNYRSRDTVVGAVNFVFSQLMTAKTCGIDYGQGEALVVGANYPEKKDCETSFAFLTKDKLVPQELMEARHIATEIRQMMAKGFTVSEGGRERPLRYRDCCVLLRTANKYAAAYAREMTEEQVPAWAAISEGFFSASEISQALSFLQIVDNPNQDIPLLAVLMGPLYGITPDELARLRLHDRKRSIYLSLLEDETGRFQPFLKDMESFRLLAAAMPSDRFLACFYTRTGFLNIVLAMEKGESRRANLMRLQEYAREYEAAGYIGIAGFVRFVDKLKNAGSDMEGADLTAETADVVRVMSIHKSKGLEFPVCFVAGCGRKFNKDISDVLLNSSLGLGVKRKDPETGARYSNVVRDAVGLQNNAELMAEELRVLYVAMTRAREKLCMVSTVSSPERALARLAPQLGESPTIEPYAVKNVGSMAEWLLLCALRHPQGQILRDRALAPDKIINRQVDCPLKIMLHATKSQAEKPAAAEREEALPNKTLTEEIRKNIGFVYPNALINAIPAKVTASALAEEKSGQVESLPRPAFLSSKGLTPAERGIALHSYLQFCDFATAALAPQAECDRLVAAGFITKEEGAAVNLSHVKAFFASDLGKRCLAATTLLKEQRFAVEIPASLVREDLPTPLQKTPVLLQGAVDCAFVQGEKLYIIDFKTDRLEQDADLAKAYGMQLMLYAHALEQVKSMPIGGCYLYSLYRDKAIEIS